MMKITAFILLVGCLHATAGGFSQTVTLSEKDAPMTRIFSLIEKQTHYVFFYDVDWVKKTKNVTIEVRNIQLQAVLDLLFKDQPISYKISGNIITIIRKKAEGKESETSLAPVPIDIHGKVVDENGKPVAGVTVTVKGTKKQTMTNENGEFMIPGVEENAVLTFSSVNMEGFEVKVGGQKEILAKLKTKTSELDEVQIIAYGQTTKRLQTGNVSTVKAEDIEKQPVNNPLLALEGRVPGLFITQTGGLPGSGVTVRIQGQNSIGSGNDPLYVIDGVPYSSQLLPTTIASGQSGVPSILNGGSPFSFINPADIESIEVLKDADATAIYGARAANGAILITTKKGKAGKTKIGANLQQGWGKVGRKMDLLNSQQYLEMRKEAFLNDGLTVPVPDPNTTSDYDLTMWDAKRYTDWQKVLIGGTAKYTNLNANISGGSSMIQYLVGGTYHRETTVFPGTFTDQKASAHFNIHAISANQKFSFQLFGNYTTDNNQLPQGDLTSQATTLAPVAPNLYNEDGTLNWMLDVTGTSSWTNPLSNLLATYQIKTDNLITSAILSYSIISGLDVKCSFGYNNMHSDEVIASPEIAQNPEYRLFNLRYANYANNSGKLWLVEPQASYKRSIGKGKFEALVGSTIQQNNTDGKVLLGSGYNTDAAIKDIRSASSINVLNTVNAIYKYNALFGRLNYNLRDKYILSLTGRRDGSSRFGAKNQFHNFGSVGAAWIFSQEDLVQNNLRVLSFGKLKASYGTTGNDQIGDYTFMNLYNPINLGVGYQGTSGLILNGLPNPYLQWEETKKLQFGIDLGFIKDRILFNATYARNRSSNQLLQYALPSITGNSSITENFPATVQNLSWEFSLNTTNVKSKSLSWISVLNLTIPQNKLISFPGLATSTYARSLIVGQPITVQKVFHFAGVDPAKGIYQFTDKNGNITLSPDYSTDRTILINTFPKFYGGFQNSIRYKGFQLDILLQYVRHVGINYSFFPVTVPGRFLGGNGNQPVTVLGRWKKPGDATTIQRFGQDYTYFDNIANASLSDQFYSDASFTRLKNLSLSYLLPEQWLKKVHFQSCKIYLSGQNLFTITSYNGMDPENPDINNTHFLPPLRVLTFGLQVEL